MLPGIGATVAHPDAPRAQESGFAQLADNYNHLSSFSYDFAGNTSNDGVNGYLWNAESDLKTAAGVNYLYDAPFASRMILRDGDGRRAAKANSANPPVPYKLYWYGPGGEILAETDGSNNILNEYVFFGGKRVALLPAGSTAQFYAEDMLGSTRIVTTNTGVVCYDADSYPYGGERTPYTNSCTQNNYKFEGKERDTETGNDDFGARYYSNRFGRWLSADWSSVPVAVPYANLTNPQTLNLYAMVSDNPETFADLDGHCVTGASGAWCVDALTAESDKKAAQQPQNQALSLCAQTSGCSQTTDKNGVTTVTVVSKDASVTTNKDGSIAMTSTTTTQTYTFNQAGNMTGGQYKTEGTTLTMGTNGQTTTQPITDSGNLNLGNAMHQFGAQALNMFQSGFDDTRGAVARFPGTVAADAKAHPRTYLGAAAEVGLLFVPVAQEAEGFKLSLELHAAAVELVHALE